MPMISHYFECKLIGTLPLVLQSKNGPTIESFLASSVTKTQSVLGDQPVLRP